VADALLAANMKLLCDDPTLTALTATNHNHPIATLKTHLFPASPETYTTEHLSLTLAVRTMPSLAAMIMHINEHSSHHTDCIVTELTVVGSTFMRGIDPAGVFLNTSTHFADGFRYGFGTEVGISTGWIHCWARGTRDVHVYSEEPGRGGRQWPGCRGRPLRKIIFWGGQSGLSYCDMLTLACLVVCNGEDGPEIVG
jgi:gamma-glutamyl phosphate reductase